jgi:thymidylate synthase
MKQYLDALQYIHDNGEVRLDRTGTGTIGVFGMQQRYDLRKGFPAMTTKKLAWKAVVSELLWFIEGSGDERRLAEILHGTRDADKKTIWTDNANAEYWKPKARYTGSVGRIYGVQWRHWLTRMKQYISSSVWEYEEVDQLANVIESIKKDPYGRRHIITSWNPAELDEMALPPCHILMQFYVSADQELSCHMYQRSNDFFLGCPFNIASYALLTHMIAQVCDLGVGEFIHTTGDAHIYSNHVEQVKEQLSREPLPLPTLWLNSHITSIDKFTMDDIQLVDYKSLDAIKAPMAV